MIDLSKLHGIQILTYIFLIMTLIIPGVAYLYFENSALFFRLDYFRFVVLSILFSMPLLVLTSLTIMFLQYYSQIFERNADEDLMVLGISSFLSMLLFLFALLIWWITKFNLLVIMYTIPLLFFIIALIRIYKNKKKK